MRSKTSAPRTWPETTSSHCYDWISPETVIRLALAAYYATSRELDHLPDDPNGEDLTFNNGRESFAEDLAEDFRLRGRLRLGVRHPHAHVLRPRSHSSR